ncbi:ABC-three component system middle component 8 [Xenorhabdus innexi]
MLTLLKNERVVSYGKLRDYAKKTINSGEVLFLPALNFLFLMGLIEYHTKIDSIEYVGPNETI